MSRHESLIYANLRQTQILRNWLAVALHHHHGDRDISVRDVCDEVGIRIVQHHMEMLNRVNRLERLPILEPYDLQMFNKSVTARKQRQIIFSDALGQPACASEIPFRRRRRFSST